MQLIGGSEENGWTNLHFVRPLNTGDTTQDRVIQHGIFTIFAYGEHDPSNPEGTIFERHVDRGSEMIDYHSMCKFLPSFMTSRSNISSQTSEL